MANYRVVSNGGGGWRTKVIGPDGQPLPGVIRAQIGSIEADDTITVTIEVCADVDIEAHRLLFGIDTLTRSAAALGYRLVPING